MTWFEEANAQFAHKWAETAKKEFEKYLKSLKIRKEVHTMRASYNGFTGELVKLEKKAVPYEFPPYDLSIYDSERQALVSFTGVKLEDVKFLGGEVSFCEGE